MMMGGTALCGVPGSGLLALEPCCACMLQCGDGCCAAPQQQQQLGGWACMAGMPRPWAPAQQGEVGTAGVNRLSLPTDMHGMKRSAGAGLQGSHLPWCPNVQKLCLPRAAGAAAPHLG